VTPASELPDDFLSGTSGQIVGIRATSKALVTDALADMGALLTARPWRLRRAARRWPRRHVLALGIERAGEPNLMAGARAELERTRHTVRFDTTPAGERGKFENLNGLLARHQLDGYDWVLVVDDDVRLPRGFLDVFVFLAERFELRLAQPAHRALSHAAWPITRRRMGSLVRETAYVEIGPVVGFQAATFEVLLPFPELRAGWGLDAHWAALAQSHRWRMGIIDAIAVGHRLRQIAGSYKREEAIAEGRRFLADRPYLNASESQRTLVTHRRWT
jgi:hypothetical protein